jgi:Bacterial mobilisation protein (MobC)
MTKPINTEDGAKTKPSLGRPRTTKVKDHWISFRVTAEQHFQLLDKAERSGMSAGEYARSRTMRGIARSKKTASSTDELFGSDTRTLIHELRKQGVNLNQIAHHCNRHQIPPPRELNELATVLRSLWDRLVRS